MILHTYRSILTLAIKKNIVFGLETSIFDKKQLSADAIVVCF